MRSKRLGRADHVPVVDGEEFEEAKDLPAPIHPGDLELGIPDLPELLRRIASADRDVCGMEIPEDAAGATPPVVVISPDRAGVIARPAPAC